MILNTGGQEVFYPTHQFFLTSQSIFLIVFDLTKPCYERLDYWVNQITSSAPIDVPIIFVGTHKDEISQKDEGNYLEEVRGKIESLKNRLPDSSVCWEKVIEVSCKSGEGMRELKKTLKQVAGRMDVQFRVPNEWILILRELRNKQIELNNSKSPEYIFYQDFLELIKKHCIADRNVPELIEFLKNAGAIIYFNDQTARLNEIVILNPQWLSDLMAQFVTFTHNYGRLTGVIKNEAIPQILKIYPEMLHNQLLQLLEQFKIIKRIKKKTQESFVVPCLMPVSPPSEEFTMEGNWFTKTPEESIEHTRIYEWDFLPIGFFDKLIFFTFVAQGYHPISYWRNGFLMSSEINYDQTAYVQLHVPTVEEPKYRITVNTRIDKETFLDHSRENELFCEIIQAIENILSHYYSKLGKEVKRLIPCPHCLKELAPCEPYLFKFEDAINSGKNGEHFLFCGGINAINRAVSIYNIAPDLKFVSDIIDPKLLLHQVLELGGDRKKIYSATYKNKEVAIKEFVIKDRDISERFITFRKEVETMRSPFCFHFFTAHFHLLNLSKKIRKLAHQNIVQYIGVTMFPFSLVMEWVPGGNLRHLLLSQTRGPKIQVSWLVRCQIALDIVTGMMYLHSLSPPIIHQNLNSSNILLVSTDPAAKVFAQVTGFGLATFEPESGRASTLWRWTAPELMRNPEAIPDQRSDVYSFGMVLYELVSGGLLPFEDYAKTDKDADTKKAIKENNRRPIIPADIPEDVAALIKRCWDEIPDNRPTFIEIFDLLFPHAPRSATKENTTEIKKSKAQSSASFYDNIPVLGKSIQPKMTVPIGHSIKQACLVQKQVWLVYENGSIGIFPLSSVGFFSFFQFNI